MTTDATQPTTITLTVPDISCGHCKQSIEGHLADKVGVSAAMVTVDERTVEVAFDPAYTSADEVAAAIESIGYTVAGHTQS